MEHPYVELVGYAAAAASLYAAYAKTIIPLRYAAIVANGLGIIYSFNHGTNPSLILNLALLPLNALRLRTMLNLIRDVAAAGKGDLNVDWLLPFMRAKQFKAGDTLVRRGDTANEAFYILAGEVEIIEIKKIVGSGSLIGEIGLFTDDGRRTMTARCKTDVSTASITYERFKELYFQNPQFGFYLLRLVVARLQDNAAQPGSAMPG